MRLIFAGNSSRFSPCLSLIPWYVSIENCHYKKKILNRVLRCLCADRLG